MSKKIYNYEKVYKILISHPDDLFTVKELSVMTDLEKSQVRRALQTLKEKGAVKSWIDQYSGFGNRRKYYGLTNKVYKKITMEKRR